LHVHDPDEDYPTALAEAYGALTDLRAAGVARAVSLGANHAEPTQRSRHRISPPVPLVVQAFSRFGAS
jgi:D-threo-aldose 1-dehydrogenase